MNQNYSFYVKLLIKENKLDEFINYEEKVELIINKFNGKVMQKFIDPEDRTLHEVHLLSFPSERYFKLYMNATQIYTLDEVRNSLIASVEFLDLSSEQIDMLAPSPYQLQTTPNTLVSI